MFSDFLKNEKLNIQFNSTSLCNKILWEFEDKLHDFFTWVLKKRPERLVPPDLTILTVTGGKNRELSVWNSTLS